MPVRSAKAPVRNPRLAPSGPLPCEALPAELEHRIARLETGRECGEDFDAASLRWLFVLGVLLPLGLLMVGWLA